MSTAILKLSENGDLQRIHDKWLMRSACTAQGTTTEVTTKKKPISDQKFMTDPKSPLKKSYL